MDRYVCIHGHFYQPPRENPWLEAVELQDSAQPYHDWNERITAECYAPNGTSRILDGEGRISRLVNNYSRMSFNFGPTLLAWMEGNAPDSHAAIVEADRQSRRRFSGHGSALAQAYNHMILPLANPRDKRTQVVWGIKDFQHRFGRNPEGMWIPETAVNIETLEVLAEHGIVFTILAPRQARAVRRLGARQWRDVSGARIDPAMAYRLALPSGRSINLFFYDGPISSAVAFEGLLNNGETFAARILQAFNNRRSWPQLAHIATDGESYGHHHKHGDMALAYALDYIESNKLALLTNYGEYLEKHPPTHEVRIFESSSWSCIHGLERWRGDCGCNSGGYPSWNQAWRGPLREALDWLRDSLAPPYLIAAAMLVKDPWAARDDYIDVVLDRSSPSIDSFISRHATRPLNEPDRIRLLKLLELQRHAMLMYTSCGWFFDDLSGIETVQILRYAGRVVQLAQELFGGTIERQFLRLLQRARSNLPEHKDGRRIYDKWVRPAMLDLTKVAAHYAISCLFEDYERESSIYSYDVVRESYESFQAGRAKLAVGRVKLTSTVTLESSTTTFGVLHMGDHNLNCGVREWRGDASYAVLVRELSDAFVGAHFADIIRLMDKHFGVSSYSLASLFVDEKRKVMDLILEPSVSEATSAYSQIHEHHAPLISFLRESGLPIPRPLHAAAEFDLNERLRQAFSQSPLDAQSIEHLLQETRLTGVSLETTALEFALRKCIERMAERLARDPKDIELLQNLCAGVAVVESVPFAVNLRRVQDTCYEMIRATRPKSHPSADRRDKKARQWAEQIKVLSEKLWIRVD